MPRPSVVAAEPPPQSVAADPFTFEAHLRSLQAVVAELGRPLPLARIAAVVTDAAIAALDAEAMIVAVNENDDHLRGVHVAGLSQETRRRLCGRPNAAPFLIGELGRSLRRAGTRPTAASIATLPISHGARSFGLIVLGRSHDRPFSDDERRFMVVLAGLCALALDRLRMCADRARVLAVLRRSDTDRATAIARLRVGDMEIDLEAQTILIGSRRMVLTPCEMRLVAFLAEQPGRARSRRDILRHVWHTEHVGDERACDVHISNLRRKIEDDASRPQRLVTLRGFGYALRSP
ncbi:MAG TPA: winged helix-turn-helix domain-containing protein [Solirubrobacteraceae bacterium]|nr:winged helix-turn-helix domain-containing protein [Solirubrobacteraceae bacterium]